MKIIIFFSFRSYWLIMVAYHTQPNIFCVLCITSMKSFSTIFFRDFSSPFLYSYFFAFWTWIFFFEIAIESFCYVWMFGVMIQWEVRMRASESEIGREMGKEWRHTHTRMAVKKRYSVINSLWKNFKFENDAECVKADQFFGQNSFIIHKNQMVKEIAIIRPFVRSFILDFSQL